MSRSRRRSHSLTIDELARTAGTTVRQVRALQTQGLIGRPVLVGRTGFYDREQVDRLGAIQRLQRQGFSLAGIAVLFRALEQGLTVEQLVGLDLAAIRVGPAGRPGRVGPPDRAGGGGASEHDDQFEGWPDTPTGRLLSVVPTTWLERPEAS